MLLPTNFTFDLQLISLDFARFCNFFNVVTNRWTDGQTDQRIDGPMDGAMDVQFFFLSKNAIDAS